MGPEGGGGPPVEQSGFGEHVGAGAERHHPRTAPVGAGERGQQFRVGGAGPASRDDHGVGARHGADAVLDLDVQSADPDRGRVGGADRVSVPRDAEVPGGAEEVVGDGCADGGHPVGEHAHHAVTLGSHDSILPHAAVRDNVSFLAHDVIRDASQQALQCVGSKRHNPYDSAGVLPRVSPVCGGPGGPVQRSRAPGPRRRTIMTTEDDDEVARPRRALEVYEPARRLPVLATPWRGSPACRSGRPTPAWPPRAPRWWPPSLGTAGRR